MTNLKYSGLAAIVVGIIIVTLFVLFNPPSNNVISSWLIWNILTVSQILPFVALGIVLALLSRKIVTVAFIAFLLGYIIALINYSKVWIYFANQADISQHLYLSLPFASLCSGLLLLLPNSFRKYIVVFVSFIIAAMLAISVKLTDPTLHDPIIPTLGLVIALWIILSFMICVKFFYKSWFPIAIRIVGSWLLASGLLYGGTAFAIKYGVIKPKIEPSKTLEKEPVVDDELLVPDFT